MASKVDKMNQKEGYGALKFPSQSLKI